jgi:hypothetical protein
VIDQIPLPGVNYVGGSRGISSGGWGKQLGQLGGHSGAISRNQRTQPAQHQPLIQGEQLQAHHTGLGQSRSQQILNRPIQGPGGLMPR